MPPRITLMQVEDYLNKEMFSYIHKMEYPYSGRCEIILRRNSPRIEIQVTAACWEDVLKGLPGWAKAGGD